MILDKLANETVLALRAWFSLVNNFHLSRIAVLRVDRIIEVAHVSAVLVFRALKTSPSAWLLFLVILRLFLRLLLDAHQRLPFLGF